MDAFLDTVVWLANFPATHGYAMVFIAAFSSLGLFATASASLSASRRARRLGAGADEAPRPVGAILRRAQGWFFTALGVVILAGGVIGVASLVMGPVTAGYIHGNGLSAEGTLEDDYVTFTADDGRTYTLPFDFFTEPLAPDRDAFIVDGPVAVRYLAGHPQAYVIDTERTPGL